MFKCKDCGSLEFNLVVQPNYRELVRVTKNEHDEIVVATAGREFVADLMFMNQFAVCTCGEIQKWEYYFPNVKSGQPSK